MGTSAEGERAALDSALRDRLLAVKVADLCDGLHQLGRPVRVAGCELRPVVAFPQVVGTAITVRTFLGPGKRDYNEQAADLYDLGRSCPWPVMVLRCDVPGFVNWGSGGARVARSHGYTAAVVHGPVRDSSELRSLEFPVFATGLRPDSIGVDEVPSGSSIHFEIGVPVEIAGAVVKPGDVIVGDNDGLMALAPDEVRPALAEAEKIIALEERIFAALDKGLTFRQILHELPECGSAGKLKPEGKS